MANPLDALGQDMQQKAVYELLARQLDAAFLPRIISAHRQRSNTMNFR